MRRYIKLIILSSVLLVVITLMTLAMTFDVDLALFKNLSIAGLQEKKMSVDDLSRKQTIEESNNAIAKSELQNSKNSFDVAKETYESIDETTIQTVQEATKEEKYFIEYLWIVLGNYAQVNNVTINIETSGSTSQGSINNTPVGDPILDAPIGDSTSSTRGLVKITIEGRYANIADFVFDVENDKSLRFKLDNINMTYSGNNKVKATFDVLSLAVLN